MKQSTTHDKYPSFIKPVLYEALCEFHFDYKNNQRWNPSYPGEILKLIQKEYPNFESLQNFGIGYEIDKQGHITQQMATQQIYKYSNTKNNHALILSGTTFAFSIRTKDYDYSWTDFKKKLLTTWKKVKTVIPLNHIVRIGTRFINHIPLKDDELPLQWLKKDSPYLPTNILSKDQKVTFRSEFHNDTENSTIIMFAFSRYEKKNFIIFDIDRINKKELPNDHETLIKTIENLHFDVEDVFFKSITEDLKKKMGEQ